MKLVKVNTLGKLKNFIYLYIYQFMKSLHKNHTHTSHIPKFILQNLSLLQERFPEKSEVISAYHQYISQQKFESGAQIINNFIGFLDMHFIDQITKQYQFTQVQSKEF